MKLVIATKNTNKIIEIRNKFSSIHDLELIPLSHFPNAPEVTEDGSTYEENALKKARSISAFTRLPVIADDSGLEVEALGGKPGVYSARYGGGAMTDTERNQLLLNELNAIPAGMRNAKFVCVIVMYFPGNFARTVRGECTGTISFSMAGVNGFGYDPVFYLHGHQRTMAELTLDEKNRISHRARALDQAREILADYVTLPRQ